MTDSRHDNIRYRIALLCGATVILAPVCVVVFLLGGQRRKAFQAAMTGALTLAAVIGVRALLLSGGVQPTGALWVGLNVMVLVIFPLAVSGQLRRLAWPK